MSLEVYKNGALQTVATNDSNKFATIQTSTKANKAYAVNEYLVLNNIVYRVTKAIASGGTIVVGTNVAATTIGNEISQLKTDLSAQSSRLKSQNNVDFNFQYDSTSQQFGYLDASGQFTAFGGGALSTKCKVKSICEWSFHTNMAASYPGAIRICNDDGSYYSNYAADGTGYYKEWLSNSDLIQSSRVVSNTLYVTLAKAGYYTFSTYPSSQATLNPTLYEAGQEVVPGNTASIKYYGITLPN